MHGIAGLQSVVTYPVGAGLTQRIVIDGPRGAIFEYDNSNNLVGSWASSAGTDPYGHAYPQGFSITVGTISGNFFVINSSGFFVYSGTPALGNLIATITSTGGTDTFGNVYLEGFTSYDRLLGTATQMDQGTIVFGLLTAFPGGLLPEIGISGTNDALVLESGQQGGATMNAADLTLKPRDGALGFVSGLALFNASIEIDDNEAAGELLVVKNLTGNPTNANLLILNATGNDKSIGVRVQGRSNDSLQFADQGMSAGPGTSALDTVFLRNSAGVWRSDTQVWDNSGAAETWHNLGTLTGATVNIARYRMLPTGMVYVQIDITFGVATAASTLTFSNNIPATWRPLASDVDVRAPMAMTNGSGVIARIFVGQAGGGNPGAVQFVNLGAGNYLGTYSAEFEYPVI